MVRSDYVATTLAMLVLGGLVVFLVVMLVLKEPIIPGNGTQASQASQASQTSQTAAPVAAPAFIPFAYNGLVRDLYNRDPVCYGDPVCRDAYFRDWPYARRPYDYRHDSSRRDSRPPIQVSVNAPATATASPNIYVQSPPPSTSTPAPSAGMTSNGSADSVVGSEGVASNGPTETVDAIMTSSGIDAPPAVEVDDDAVPSGDLNGADAMIDDGSASPLMDGAAVTSAGKRIAKAGVRAGRTATCPAAARYGTVRCGAPDMDVFPAGMDKSAYAL